MEGHAAGLPCPSQVGGCAPLQPLGLVGLHAQEHLGDPLQHVGLLARETLLVHARSPGVEQDLQEPRHLGWQLGEQRLQAFDALLARLHDDGLRRPGAEMGAHLLGRHHFAQVGVALARAVLVPGGDLTEGEDGARGAAKSRWLEESLDLAERLHCGQVHEGRVLHGRELLQQFHEVAVGQVARQHQPLVCRGGWKVEQVNSHSTRFVVWEELVRSGVQVVRTSLHQPLL